MTFYLISFPSEAMEFSGDELVAVAESSHAAIRDAKAAGVYVFGGGINEDVPAVRVHEDGSVTNDTFPQTATLNGGFTVLNVGSREEAEEWAHRIAVGCRTTQELREFMFDPES